MSIQKRRMEISLSALLRDSREKQTHAYRLMVGIWLGSLFVD